jgi:ribosomal protein S18 acetylase RimI-like enzyme
MAALGAQYEFSEYKMVLGQPTAPVTLPEQILLKPASTADLEIMTMMDHLCFDVPLEPQKTQTNDQPPQPRPGTQLITRNGQPIGKIHTTQSDDESYIAGFCMLPEYRGQGIGRAVLSQVVAQLVAEQRPNIVLEVATSNESALSLYKRQGFETSTAFDYYRLPILKDKKP